MGVLYAKVAGVWQVVDSGGGASNPPTTQIFTASGTWTKPVGCVYAVIEVQAAGGGGGGAPTAAAGTHSLAQGGGAGGYARSIVLATNLGATEVVTVGAAGIGVSGGTGTTGGNSSFGSWAAAQGAVGGIGTGATSGFYGYGAPNAGLATAGDIQIAGAHGQNAWGNAGFAYSGHGGDSMLGAGGFGRQSSAANSLPGLNAGGYGAGGGGAAVFGVTGAQPGGNGSPGVVIVTSYFGSAGGIGVANPTFTTVYAQDVQVQGSSLPRGVPSGTNGFAQNVANAGGGSTVLTPISGLSITPTLDPTRRYRLAFGGTLSSGVVNDRAIFGFVEGAGNTPILQMQTQPMAVAGSGYWYEGSIYLSGVSGAKNYKAATKQGPGATGTISVLASTGVPAYIMIEDVGAA